MNAKQKGSYNAANASTQYAKKDKKEALTVRVCAFIF